MASTTNRHMRRSIRNVTASPRNRPAVVSIMQASERLSVSSSWLTQWSMMRTIMTAGIRENSERNHIWWLPKRHFPSITIHR